MEMETITKFQKYQPLTPNEQDYIKSLKVISPKVMYIFGVPSHLSTEAMLGSQKYFAKYGPIESIRINKKPIFIQKKKNEKFFRAYITYKYPLSCSIAILSINGQN
jgi:hypothetical protein